MVRPIVATFFVPSARLAPVQARPGRAARGAGAHRAATEGGPFPGKLPKAPVVVTKAAITKAE